MIPSIDSLIAWAGRIGPVLWRQRYWMLAWPAFLKARSARCSYASDFLIEFLQNLYPHAPLLTVGGQTYPVAFYPPTMCSTNLPSIAFDKTWRPTIPWRLRGREYYWLMRTSIPSDERKTFVLKQMTHDPLHIECGWADYFAVLRSADALEWELLKAIVAGSSTRSMQGFLDLLPLRKRLHETNSDPLRNGDGRADALAVSCFLIFETSAGRKALLKVRGKQSQALRKGMLHVVPAGMFQAPFQQPEVECSVLHCFLWEFYEELFGAEDPKIRIREQTMPKWFYSKPPVKEIQGLLSKGRATLYYTGVAVDLLNLRPEILLMLHVLEPSWFKKHSEAASGEAGFKFTNEEWAPVGASSSFREIALPTSEEELFAQCGINRTNIAPPSAAALVSGMRCLASIGRPDSCGAV